MPPEAGPLRGFATLTDEVLAIIEGVMEKGRPMSVGAELAGVNYEMLKTAVRFKPEVRVRLLAARARGSMAILDAAEEAAKDGRSTHYHQWMAHKLNPKAFSEKMVEEDAANEAPLMDAEVTGTSSTPTEATEAKLEHTREELAVIGRALYEHEKKKREAATATSGEEDEDDEEG